MVVWIGVAAALAIGAVPGYHAGKGAYLKFHLDSVTANVMQHCNGPVTDSTPSYQRDQINDCISKDEDLTKAKADYAAFTDSAKK